MFCVFSDVKKDLSNPTHRPECVCVGVSVSVTPEHSKFVAPYLTAPPFIVTTLRYCLESGVTCE